MLIPFMLLLLALFSSGCSPQKAGVDLLVTGKTFSLTDVLVDGKSVVGNVNKDTSRTIEGITSFSLDQGTHLIELIGSDGRHVEIEAKIKARDNYVSYDSAAGRIQWNDGEYQVSPGRPVIIK